MHQTPHPLAAAITAESGVLREFIAVLREEQQLLLAGSTEQIARFAETKSRLVLELTRLNDARLQQLRQHGFSADRDGMEKLLDAESPADTMIAGLWQQFLQLAASAERLNATNGLLIGARMSYTQRALHALFSAARLPAAYASDGSTIRFRTAHQIAIA
jgi:flagella synthesis protein FlgN